MIPGQISHYQITGKLGAGGMGEVWRARDERLGREVAIKLLPASFAHDPDRLRRFEQEARATSALNHPNILTVYDIGTTSEGDGHVPFLVMELLEGEELRAQLQEGALAPRLAVEYARQIAAGLAAAHARGVVHRDLKPENVFVTTDGRVKILDFGLAKLRPSQRGGVDTNAPTQKQITDPGTVMGTVGYMSPEQVRGQETDHRSDIFSLGVILYEMLAGERPFGGESAVETMNAILKKDAPELDAANAKVSPQLERIVRRCLEKRPEQRFQSASDLGFALEALSTPSGSRPEIPSVTASLIAPAKPRLFKNARLAWIVAGVSVLALLTALPFAVAHLRQARPREASALRFTIAPPEKATTVGAPMISPDGRNLIFGATVEGKRQIWLRPLNSSTAQPLAGTEGYYCCSFWSPDSRSIGFSAGGKLKRIDVAGGAPLTICDLPGIGGNGAWGYDGTIIFYGPGAIYRVPATGGQPVPIIANFGGRSNAVIIRPYFLPDGRHFLHYASATQEAGIYLASVDGKEERRLLAADSDGIYATSATQNPGKGWLLFLREGALLAQPFDADRLALTGEPSLVVDQVEAGRFFVSNTGILAYQPRRTYEDVQLGWLDRAGKPVASIGATGFAFVPELSPDGKRVAVMRMNVNGQGADVHVIDVTRNTESRLTFDPADDGSPIWSPDGNRIVSYSNRGQTYHLYQKLASGVGPEEPLLQADVLVLPRSWSADGRFILYNRTGPKTLSDIWVLPLDGDRRSFPFLQTPFIETDAQFFRDGHWVAYTSNESGNMEVYVQTFPAGDGKWKVSTNAGQVPFPRWRGDGKELYYISADRKLMAVEVKLGATFEAGVPKPLFDLAAAKVQRDTYTVTADGQRFLFPRQTKEAPPAPFSVIVNWTAEVKR